MSRDKVSVYTSYILKRLHSLMGLFLVIFIIEHLITNSLSASLWNDNGSLFIKAVDLIEQTPHLKLIEILFLAIPILYHGIWGIVIARKAAFNVTKNNLTKPFLASYERNWAYSFQRITSWILMIGIIFHVIQMRFLNHPEAILINDHKQYVVQITSDRSLDTLAQKLNVELLDSLKLEHFNNQNFATIYKYNLEKGDVLAVSQSFGAAVLLVIRDTFKNPFMIVIYTLFVLSAAFHAFNGLWTFLISYGLLIGEKKQYWMLKACYFFMAIVSLLGFLAIFGSYYLGH